MRTIEAITWLDPTTHSGWYTEEEMENLKLDACVSIGCVVSEEGTLLKIATSFSEGGGHDIGDIGIIHKVLVTNRKVIAEI